MSFIVSPLLDRTLYFAGTGSASHLVRLVYLERGLAHLSRLHFKTRLAQVSNRLVSRDEKQTLFHVRMFGS